MDVWVGPVIIAALVSGLVSAAGWFVTFRQSLEIELHRREERIRDFRIALRAEVRADLKNLERFDFAAHVAEIEQRYSGDPAFSVAVAPQPRSVIFPSIAAEIHILPESMIDPAVLYLRQRQVIESQIEAMRDNRFSTLSRDRQIAIYRDYIGMMETWRELARGLEKALSYGESQ